MLFEERIKKWLNESHPAVRLTDNRDNTAIWQSELINVEAGKDGDQTPVTILNLKNGYALRIIHKDAEMDLSKVDIKGE